MRHLQGNLQNIFDALYQLGVIDPVLQMDWQKEYRNEENYSAQVHEAVEVANRFQNDFTKLVEELNKLDEKTLSILAMEVAREFANYHTRTYTH